MPRRSREKVAKLSNLAVTFCDDAIFLQADCVFDDKILFSHTLDNFRATDTVNVPFKMSHFSEQKNVYLPIVSFIISSSIIVS